MTQAHRDVFSPTDRPFGTLRQIASTGPQSCCSFLCSAPPHLCRLRTAGLARRRSWVDISRV